MELIVEIVDSAYIVHTSCWFIIMWHTSGDAQPLFYATGLLRPSFEQREDLRLLIFSFSSGTGQVT